LSGPKCELAQFRSASVGFYVTGITWLNAETQIGGPRDGLRFFL